MATFDYPNADPVFVSLLVPRLRRRRTDARLPFEHLSRQPLLHGYLHFGRQLIEGYGRAPLIALLADLNLHRGTIRDANGERQDLCLTHLIGDPLLRLL